MTEPRASEPRAPRVVIVDDDTLVRTLLTTILRATGIDVVGEADDGDGAVPAVLAHHPDVVLMDLRMARVSGIDATRQVRELTGAPGVIALTSFDTRAAILDAVAAGVAGFLAKDAAPEEIAQAVRQVAAGEGALSPRAARVVLEQMQSASDDPARRGALTRLAALTPREQDVARAVASGLSNGEVAARMYVSEATVKTHLVSALAKVGVANRVQLAVLVATAGDAW